MKVVSDAGPLMALAKIGGLDALFKLFSKIWTPPAVYEELITAGLHLGTRMPLSWKATIVQSGSKSDPLAFPSLRRRAFSALARSRAFDSRSRNS